MWHPCQNWMSLMCHEEHISFDDIESGSTEKDRIDINTVDNVDILERARKDIAQGREHGWDGYPRCMFKWELCPHCKTGELIVVKADEPWHTEHLQCKSCDSTYNIQEIVK